MSILVASLGFGLVTASIFALAAVGFTMQFGVTNILNLAYGDLMIAAAFVAYACNSAGLNIWLCLPVCAIFGAVASMLLNRLLFSPFIRRGTKLFGMVIVTLAVGLMLQNIILAITGPSYFSYAMSVGQTLTIGSVVLTTSQVGIMAIAIVAMLAIHSLLAYTRLGKAMRATAANAALARSCGIRTDRIVDVAWMISGGLCGISGVALAMNTTSFNTSTASGVFVVIIAAAIIGGVGDAYGAMLGAVIIGLVTEMSAVVLNPAYKDAIAFVILVLVLLVRSEGIRAVVSTQREVAA